MSEHMRRIAAVEGLCDELSKVLGLSLELNVDSLTSATNDIAVDIVPTNSIGLFDMRGKLYIPQPITAEAPPSLVVFIFVAGKRVRPADESGDYLVSTRRPDGTWGEFQWAIDEYGEWGDVM